MEIANPLATLENLEKAYIQTNTLEDEQSQQAQNQQPALPAQTLEPSSEQESQQPEQEDSEPVLRERSSCIYKLPQDNDQEKPSEQKKEESITVFQTDQVQLTSNEKENQAFTSQSELMDKTNASNKIQQHEKYVASTQSTKTESSAETFKQNNILNQILEQLISKVGVIGGGGGGIAGNQSGSVQNTLPTSSIKDKSNTENQDPGTFNICSSSSNSSSNNNIINNTNCEERESTVSKTSSTQLNNKKSTVTITSRLPPLELKQQLIQQSLQITQQQQQQQQQQMQQQRKSRKMQQVKDIKITDLIEVSKQIIKFCTVLPGNIFEENLEVMNLTNESLVVKIFVQCLNPELEDHDEYVYSVRKTTAYDYNEKYFVLIPPFKSMMFKIALKVPNIGEQKLLKGMALVSIQGIDQFIKIPISSQIEIPSIQCVKELYVADHDLNIIKLAIKRGKKQDCKIPLKNNHSSMVTFEAEWLEEPEEESAYQLILHPLMLVVQPKSPFLINAILKQNPKYKGNFQQKMDIKKVLLLKIRNSSLIYNFPLLIEIY